jgi:PAS domain S-box-containing protein
MIVEQDDLRMKGTLLSPQRIIEAIPQIAWTNMPDGKVVYFNQRWYEYTGITEEESLKDGWQSTLHPDDLPRTLDYWNFSLQNGEAFESQYRIKRYNDNEYRWHLVRATPLCNDAGDIELWVGTCTDIHEQIMSLVKLAEAQHQLRNINQELSEKNKELVKTNNDLDNFIYTASHDLKSPILNLEGLVYALSKELLSGGELVTDILNMIEVSLSRFKNTIKDLTEISKIQKNLEDEQEVVKLKEIFRDVRIGVQDMIDFSGARIQTEFDVPIIQFSRKNLRSIFYNLISNAIKYRSTDRPLVIKVKSTKASEKMVLITVSDTGLGMNLSHKDQIFSMFKRLHTHVEGSGVGLYIVKRIIENAGGSIEVESEVGVGSFFKIYLPHTLLSEEDS